MALCQLLNLPLRHRVQSTPSNPLGKLKRTLKYDIVLVYLVPYLMILTVSISTWLNYKRVSSLSYIQQTTHVGSYHVTSLQHRISPHPT